jgi:hypothetical protein
MALLLSDMNLRLLGILLVLCVLVTVTVSAQSETRNVRLGMSGYLVLPRDYRAYRTNNVRHPSSGYIVCADHKTIVVWSTGSLQMPFDNGDGKFVWVKREQLGKTLLKYGLLHANDTDIVAAALPGLNLVMVLRSNSDMNTFLKIARSFRREKCQGCERPLPDGPSNKSLDASGGSVFRN